MCVCVYIYKKKTKIIKTLFMIFLEKIQNNVVICFVLNMRLPRIFYIISSLLIKVLSLLKKCFPLL